MIGFNSRETCQGSTYDIQTQDQTDRRVVETRLYRDGKILSVIETPYLAGDRATAFQERMFEQHDEVCTRAREGVYGLLLLWISKGTAAYESGDILKSLRLFESAWAIDQTHPELNLQLKKIRDHLESDPESRALVADWYQEQRSNLLRAGRRRDASRKKAVLACILGQRCTRRSRRKRGSGAWAASAAGHGKTTHFGSPLPMHLAVAISGLLLILFTGVMLADEQLTLDPQYQVALGKVYLERDRTLLARNVLSGVLMQHPYSEEAFLGFWETFERRGDYQAAAQALERFLGSEHAPPLSIFYLAEAYRLSSKFQAAADCYRKALAQGFPEQACRIGLYLCLIGQQSVSGVVGLLED